MKYLGGKSLPGEELRAKTLDFGEIYGAIGTVYPGTFNVFFGEDLELGVPTITTEKYDFWACEMATEGMIEREEPGLPGYIIRVSGENLPANFAEIVSPIHIRTALKKTNWPSFPIEIALKGVLNSSEVTDEKAKVGPDTRKRVRNPSGRAGSA